MTKKITIYLREAQFNHLNQLCKRKNISMSEAIRLMVDYHRSAEAHDEMIKNISKFKQPKKRKSL